MKKLYKFFIIFLFLLFLSACNKKEYIYFNYNCNGKVDYHKCELKNNKINCNVLIPTCSNQKFLGWYEANEYEISVDLTKIFTKNEILYARWETVEEPSSQIIEEPSSSEIEEPSSNEIEEPSSSEQPSSSQNIVATKYTITFNANGGSKAPSAQTVTYNGTLPTINIIPTREGYTFIGWYDSVSGGTQYYNSSNVAVKKYDKTSNITLHAVWKAKSYTITFNANGGSGTPSAQTVTYNGTLPTISVKPTKTGYTFIGWYDSVSGGTQYYNASNVAMKKYDKKTNITLYAVWKINELKIMYNGNGGKWNSNNTDLTSNKNGDVVYKTSGVKYVDTVNYDNKSVNLANYDNAKFISFKKDGYIAPSGSEWKVWSKTFADNKKLKATDLALAGGCDLSKRNCSITLKINWKSNEITPLAQGKIIYKQNTETLKVKIQKRTDANKSNYYLTYIWVEDPYTQSNKAHAKNYPNALQPTKGILENEVKNEKLKNKLVIATNASAYYNSSYSNCKSQWDKYNQKVGKKECGEGLNSCFCYPAKTSSNLYSQKYVNTQVGNLVITKGKVFRNWPQQEAVDTSNTLDLYGIDPNGTFRIFRNINGGNETSRKKLYKKIINTGIKNTIVWNVPIILDGKVVGWQNNQSLKNITAFCQIDKNNFVIFSARKAVYSYLVPQDFKALGCKNAVNFDGGGSVELLYKNRGGDVTRIFNSYGDNANAEIFYFTEK